jgi:hypothetical protein
VDLAALRRRLFPFAASAATGLDTKRAEVSVEQYARLRATLSLLGEDHSDTWASFGIHSAEEKRRLQSEFAEHFRSDDRERERFVLLVAGFIASMRSSTAAPNEPDLEATSEMPLKNPTPRGK